MGIRIRNFFEWKFSVHPLELNLGRLWGHVDGIKLKLLNVEGFSLARGLELLELLNSIETLRAKSVRNKLTGLDHVSGGLHTY